MNEAQTVTAQLRETPIDAILIGTVLAIGIAFIIATFGGTITTLSGAILIGLCILTSGLTFLYLRMRADRH